MSHRKHRRQSPKSHTRDHFEQEDTHRIPKKRSLGALRKNKKTKPQSPDATGKLHFQRHTLREIYGQLTDGDDEVVCNVACWRNGDQYGAYLTVEISPKFVSFERRESNGESFYDMFNEEDEQ
jgi:hypothetical protein